jgi:DNA-binding transcriptional regulator LsrR (DeoR family)
MVHESSSDIERQAPSRSRRPTSGRARKKRWWDKASPLERAEVLALICNYFCYQGLNAPQIKERLANDHGVDFTREEVYRQIRTAAKNGWIRFETPLQYSLQRKFREAYPWLQDVSVVATANSEDVAYRGAKMLLELLQQHYADREVHIGFSGGYALRKLAQRFAALLREHARHLPREIVLHALVAGFDVYDPTTDPNAFFTFFVEDPAMQVKTSFVALHAPAIVDAEILPKLRSQQGIAEAYEHARKLDVIVTSTSCWTDDHSMLRQYMKVVNESAAKLERAGCVGDMLWRPLGPDGPIELETGVRAFTILELRDVSRFIEDGHHVLLVAGPCARCHTPKSEIVKAILAQEHRLATHLAVDSRCARAVLSSR